MEAGAHLEAARTYEEILKKDPQDPEAKLGLTEARSRLIDSRLIDIRRARTSGNPEQGLDHLMALLNDQAKWGLNAHAAATLTQEEETEFGANLVAKKVTSANQANHPLRASSLLLRYRPLFQDKRASRHDALNAETERVGQKHCKKLQAMDLKKAPYFAEFVIKYCAYFKEESAQLADRIGHRAADLVNDVTVTVKIKDLPNESTPKFTENFRDALKRTAWYDAEGKQTIALTVDGTLEFSRQQVPVNLVHQYKEDEPYVEVIDVQKIRQVPYETTESRINPTTRAIEVVPVTKYRQETYIEKQSVTRTREVLKTYPYGAWKHMQHLKLALTGASTVAGRAVNFSLTEELNQNSFQHDLDLPAIGLKPAKLTLTDEGAWIDEQAKRASGLFEGKLAELWKDLYCSGSEKLSLVASGEQVHRCLREQSGDAPEFAQGWYQKQLDMDMKEAMSLIGLKR